MVKSLGSGLRQTCQQILPDSINGRWAVAAMHDMGVTVDQAGCHHAPAQRPLIQSGIICWHVCLRPDPSDFAILNGDRCVADHPIGRIAMRHGCYVQIGQKLEHRRHKIGPFREVSPFLV
jgi:hypothetical protein